MNRKILRIIFFIIIVVLCALSFAACDEEDLLNDGTYETWRGSDLAEDFNGDRRITEEDYDIYKGYKEWKNSDKAYDYNGDKRINYDDYLFAVDPVNADLVTWLNSEKAYDYDGNSVIDETDFTHYNCKYLIGNFKVANFNLQQNDIQGKNRSIFLNENYSLNNLAQDIADFDFEIAKDLKLTCTYGDTVKQKLGEEGNAFLSAINSCRAEIVSGTSVKLKCNYDETVKQQLGDNETEVINAINSFRLEKLSATVTTATFKVKHLTFTVYITKTERGFSSSMSYTFLGVSMQITFDIVYVT